MQGVEGGSDVSYLILKITLVYSYKLVCPMNRTCEISSYWGIQISEYKLLMTRRVENLVRAQRQIPTEFCWTLSLGKRQQRVITLKAVTPCCLQEIHSRTCETKLTVAITVFHLGP